MDPSVLKLIIFFIAVTVVVAAYRQAGRKTSAPVRRKRPAPSQVVEAEFQGIGEREAFWVQVYDTDSADEARKVREEFAKSKVRCLIYRQGKKDVFGDRMKHYGLSVPQDCLEKAQSVLTEITL